MADARRVSPQKHKRERTEVEEVVCEKGTCLKSSENWKPNGMRHCKVCGTCILHFDHHCPFTGNCVGIGNFIYFFLFLAYCEAGLSYALFMWVTFFVNIERPTKLFVRSSRAFLSCVLFEQKENLGLSNVCMTLGSYSLLALPVAAAWCMVGILFIFHTLLLAVDKSTRNFCKPFASSASWVSFAAWKEATSCERQSLQDSGRGPSSRISLKKQFMARKFWELQINHSSRLRFWQLLAPIGLFGMNSPPNISLFIQQIQACAKIG